MGESDDVLGFLRNPHRRRATESPVRAAMRPLIKMEIETRKPEKWLILDGEYKLAWVWDVVTSAWVRAEWPLPNDTGGASLEETEPVLIETLQALFDDFGPEGVRRTVVQMIQEMKSDAAADTGSSPDAAGAGGGAAEEVRE